MCVPNPADIHWGVRLYTMWNYVLAQPCTPKAGHTCGMLFIHRTLCTPLVAHDFIRCSPLKHEGMKKWNIYGVLFFFFFDSTDIWKRFASFLWKLGWGLFKPASEDPHLERRFYILLFLGSTWLFPSHLLATTWILILCVCSFVHSFIHCTNMISMPVIRLTMVLGAGLQDRYMSPYSETRLYPGIKYTFFFFLLIRVKRFIVTKLYCIHDKTWLAQSWQSVILELGSLGSNPSCPVICCN